MRLRTRAACAAALVPLLLSACADDGVVGPAPRAPARALAAVPTAPLITEIMPNPAAVSDTDGEWFEIHNPTGSAVDLAGWSVESNDGTFSLGSAAIPAGGWLVVGRNGDSAANGGVAVDVVVAISLNNSGTNTDFLVLRDASGAVVDSVEWGAGSPPTGASRALTDLGADNATMSGPAWATSTAVYGAGDRGTPGAANSDVAVAPAGPALSEIRIDQPGTDLDEYFELSGAPGASLDGLTYVVIGDGTGGSGVVEAALDLTGRTVPASGFFVAAEGTFTLGTADWVADLNFENSDNVTHLLVDGFTGAAGDDLDADDDGVLDDVPWASVVDCVALLEETGGGDAVYCATALGPDGSFVPGHAFLGDAGWAIGAFDPAGGDDTPGAANGSGGSGGGPGGGTGPVVITEVLANPSAVSDADGEWFEVHNPGASAIDLQGWTIASNNDAAHVVGASAVVPAGGYAVVARNGDSSVNGGVTAVYAYSSSPTPNLANSSDWLALRDPAGATADSVAWNSSAPSGASRALSDPAADNADVDGAAWTTSTSTFGAGDRGTPGAASDGGSGGGEAGVPVTVSLGASGGAVVPATYQKPVFASARDAFGDVVSPSPGFTLSSSDPSIATVDARGYVTGVSAGTATISATTPNGATGSLTFTVLPADAPTSAVYRDHVEFGTPADGDPSDDLILVREQYVLSYSSTRGGPNWVAWNQNASQYGSSGRCDCFSPDPSLPAGATVVTDLDYRGGGYDRGHMVPSFPRTTTLQENATTFRLTNVLPQAAESNQGPWLDFENHLNDLARQTGRELYVIAGAEWGASPRTLKGEGRVQIPAFTWKVAVVLDGGEGLDDVASLADLEVLAIRVPNDTLAAAGIRDTPWTAFETTVDEVESRTGYDLLALLPDALELLVESGDSPPAADAGGPYAGDEGASIVFDGTGSSDPDGDVLTYRWTFGDGSLGSGARVSHAYADDGVHAVRLVVTDPYGAADTATTTVTVGNVAPTVAPLPDATLLPGETYAASGSFTDPGADSWTATVDWGEGAGPQPLSLAGMSFSLSHVYGAAGTFALRARVADDDGGAGTADATVRVLTPQQAIGDLGDAVEATMGDADARPFRATLDAARAALDRGQETAAVNQLGAFVEQVEAAVRDGRLSAAEGDALIAEARRIVRSTER